MKNVLVSLNRDNMNAQILLSDPAYGIFTRETNTLGEAETAWMEAGNLPKFPITEEKCLEVQITSRVSGKKIWVRMTKAELIEPKKPAEPQVLGAPSTENPILCDCPKCHGEKIITIEYPNGATAKRTCAACAGKGKITLDDLDRALAYERVRSRIVTWVDKVTTDVEKARQMLENRKQGLLKAEGSKTDTGREHTMAGVTADVANAVEALDAPALEAPKSDRPPMYSVVDENDKPVSFFHTEEEAMKVAGEHPDMRVVKAY